MKEEREGMERRENREREDWEMDGKREDGKYIYVNDPVSSSSSHFRLYCPGLLPSQEGKEEGMRGNMTQLF